MSGELLSLKWNYHQSTFLHVLSSLCLNDTLSDVTLACEGEFFAAHKLVLAACSEYFEKIFEKIQGKHSVIVLKDVKAEELESILNYMYQGEVNVSEDKLSGLLSAADYLKIKGLSDSDETPKMHSKLHSSQHKIDKTSLSEEASGSPPLKRKRPNYDNKKMSPTKEYDSDHVSSGEGDLSQGNKADELDFSKKCEGNCSKTQNPLPGPELEIIKDEIDIKTEEPFMLSSFDASSDFVSEDHFPEISENSTPSVSSLMDVGSMKESNTISRGTWDSCKELPVINSNKVDVRRFSSGGESASRTGDGERLAVIPNDVISLQLQRNEESSSGAFTCPLCPFITFQKNIYDTHLRRHSSEKTFFCQFCSYSCMTKSNLKCHIRKHTGEKPFSCSYCNYRSSQSSNIKIHVRRMHKIADGDQNDQNTM